jgi:hypothetical protein
MCPMHPYCCFTLPNARQFHSSRSRRVLQVLNELQLCNIRWPTSVTAKVNNHRKIKLTHGKIKLTHGKIKLTQGKIELTHGKIKLTHG